MNRKISEIIKNGGVGVLPTDTLYGLVGSAFSKIAVERIYNLKSRSERKSLVILISSVDDLKEFGVSLTEESKNFIKKYWPGKVSIILPFKNIKLSYLDKMDGTLAFRLPKKSDLIKLIKETGPIVAPSANPEGRAPAKDTDEARIYFDERIDFYVDGGKVESEPSTLVKINGNKIEVLREGAVKIAI